MNEDTYIVASTKIVMKAASMLVEEIGTEEYCWLILKAYGVPAHEIPDDPHLLQRKLASMISKVVAEGSSDEQFYTILNAMSDAGSPKVKQFIATELAVIAAFKAKIKKDAEEAENSVVWGADTLEPLRSCGPPRRLVPVNGEDDNENA